MIKAKKFLIVIVASIFLLGGFYLYFGNKEKENSEDILEIGGRVYRNESIGYEMNYPSNWGIREKRILSSFYLRTEEIRDPQTSINLETYKQFFGIDLIGTSPLTYIDGTIDYNIEQAVYVNENNFTVRQWYDVAVLMEAYVSGKISEADFIRLSNKVVKEGSITTEKERIFDPWTPEGEMIRVGKKEVVRVNRLGDSRYDGYQYYITILGNYVFVIHFGYGGPVISREMWQRSDTHVRGIIGSLKML